MDNDVKSLEPLVHALTCSRGDPRGKGLQHGPIRILVLTHAWCTILPCLLRYDRRHGGDSSGYNRCFGRFFAARMRRSRSYAALKVSDVVKESASWLLGYLRPTSNFAG